MINDIKFEVNGKMIFGTIFEPEKSNKNGVIFFHGWGSSRKGYVDRANALCELGYTCLIIDLMGFGESEGDYYELSIINHLDEAIASYDYLKNYANISEISVCGKSFGGFLTVLLSEKRPIKSMVLNAAAIYKDDILEKNNIWSTEILLLNEINKFKNIESFNYSKAINIIQKYTGSLLVVGCENDEIIPKIITDTYFKSATNTSYKEIIWIKGARHALTEEEHKKAYIQILVDWFKKI